MGNIIPAYLDIETIAKTREPEEIAFYMPTREKGQRKFSAKIAHVGEFKEIFTKAVAFVEGALQNDGDKILVLGWNLGTDKSVLDKMCIRTMTPLMPETWMLRDTLQVFKRVFPYFDNHPLQSVASRLGSKRYEPIHRAHPDNKTHYGVIKAAAHNVSMIQLYQDLFDMRIGLEKASNTLLASYNMVPVAVNIATSHKVKRDKMEEGLYPSVLAIQAFCPCREKDQRFEVLIKPPEGIEIDPIYSKGLTIEDLKDEKPFPEAFQAFTLWLDENVGPTGRNMLFSYKWYTADGKALKKECEKYDVSLPDHCFEVDLSYLKTLLLPEYNTAYWEKKGVKHSDTERLSYGFDRERCDEGEDQVFYDLRNHFHISKDLDRLEQEMELYKTLLPVHDPAVRIAMMRDKKIFDKRIVTITNAAKVNNVAHPIFLKVETTGLEKDGKAPKGNIVKVDAYAPDKPLGERRFERLVNPKRPILKAATSKHGLKDENVKDAEPWSVVQPDLMKWMSDDLRAWEKVLVISQGAFHFTLPAMQQDSHQNDLSMRPDFEWFCTQNLAQSLPRLEKHNLEAMAKQFEIDDSEGGELIHDVFMKMIDPMPLDDVYKAIVARTGIAKRHAKPIAELIERAQYDEKMAADAAEKIEAEIRKEPVRARRSRKSLAKPQTEGSRRSQRLADKKNI